MSQRYSGKSRKDSSTMKKAKLSPKEKRKLKSGKWQCLIKSGYKETVKSIHTQKT